MFDLKNLNIRLLLINITLVIAGFFLADPFHIFESSYESAPKLIKIKSPADVTSIKIINKDNQIITLNKNESGWSVISGQQKSDFPAVANRIDSALDNLVNMKKYYEVTSNEDKYTEFGVNENSLKLELVTGGKTYTLHIGKAGSSYNTTLVRLKDEKTVYSVKGNLKTDWDQNVDFFRNKRLLQITKDNLKELVVTGAKNFQITGGENNMWSLVSGANQMGTNPTRINRLLDDVSLLEGMEFYYGTQTGFPYGNIKIVLKSNIEFNMEVRKIGNDYIVKSEQNPYWQRIPEYRVNSIFPPLNELSISGNK